MAKQNIVSKDEMDALLDDASGKIPNTEEISRDGIPVNFYDFITEYHKSITRSRGFNVININFANELRSDIFRLLRLKSSVEIIEPDILPYGNYFEAYPRQATISMLEIKDTNTHALVSLDSNAIFSVIEVLFGGDTVNTEKTQREFSKIDIKVAELLTDHVCNCLKIAWESIKELEFQYIKTTVDKILPNRIPSNEKAVVQKYKIKLNDVDTELHVCLPYELLTSVSHLLEHEEAKDVPNADSSAWYNSLTQNIYRSNINVSAQITETELPLRDIANLKVGDVISIDDPAVGTLMAEGTKIFKVKCGVQEGKKVVEILHRVND